MSDYKRCPGCLEEMMDVDTDMCHGCGGCMVFQAKDAPPSAHAGEDVRRASTRIRQMYYFGPDPLGAEENIAGVIREEISPSASAPVEVTRELIELMNGNYIHDSLAEKVNK